MKLKSVFLFFFIFWGGAASAQQVPDSLKFINQYSKSIDSLKDAILGMQKKLIYNSKKDTQYREFLAKLNLIDRRFSIFSNISRKEFAAIPQVCREKLKNDFDNYNDLIQYSEKLITKDSIETILNFINEDLSNKSYGAWGLEGQNVTQLVTVRVRVLDKQTGSEISGISVFIKPVLTLAKRFIEEFNPTNNAVKEDISPGKKIIYIKKNGKNVGERIENIKWKTQAYIYDFIL